MVLDLSATIGGKDLEDRLAKRADRAIEIFVHLIELARLQGEIGPFGGNRGKFIEYANAAEPRIRALMEK